MSYTANIAQTFVRVAGEYGPKTAIIEARTGQTITFAGLNEKADCYAAYFRDRGVVPGDRVILMVTPSIDFICLTLALFKIGTPVVLIDPGMGYKNLLSCIERVAPRVLIGIPKAILFAKIFRKPFASVVKTFCCGNSFGLLGKNITRAVQPDCPSFAVYQPEKDDLAAIIFTTGSTGPPKGVCYEHSVFAAQLQLIETYYKIGPTDVDQPAFPLFALFSAALGACAVIPDMDTTKPAQVDPGKFIDSIQKYGVTFSFGSPAIWNVVSKYCVDNNIPLDTVEKILMAGAPVAYELMGRVRSILPQTAQVFTPYGATESLPIVSIEGREIVQDTYKQSRLGKGTCVGRALPGIEIKIIALSDDVIETVADIRELPTGKIGEILVRGAVVTRGYLNNAEETRLSKVYDGQTFWHRMGDLGYLDEKGRLWFCGRRAHRVEAGGKTYYSVPCEAIVNEHRDVYRAALVGVENDANSVEPVLVIEPHKQSTDGKKLLEEVRLLAKQSTLTGDIRHFLIHNDFPVDIRHNAKIFREKLSLWAQQNIYPRS